MSMQTIIETEDLTAQELAQSLLQDPAAKACFTCSFQVEDMVVLHILRRERPDVPVLFLETGYHFPETYEYRDRMTEEWNLNLTNMQAVQTVAQQESEFGILYQSEPARCCGFRKVVPLQAGLQPYDIWFTGLRREQSPTRANLKKIEQHTLPGGKTLQKVSILADWPWKDVWAYTTIHEIPHLPLYDEGYTSIGCAPCTAKPSGDDLRSGRWGGNKLECGIHTFTEAR